MNTDLLQTIYDIYAREGKVEFLRHEERFRIQAEDSDVFLMQQEEILRRFRHIKEAIAYLAGQDDVQLLD